MNIFFKITYHFMIFFNYSQTRTMLRVPQMTVLSSCRLQAIMLYVYFLKK